MVQQLSTNTFGVAKWIVSATASDGTHTTIAGALTSAASGDTIFVRPGTYTENLTLKAGVNITAFTGDAGEPNVTIVGLATATTAGTFTISNIRLQTNSNFFLVVSGTAATIVNLNSCYLNCSNNTGISSTSTLSSIFIEDCMGNIGTTGISLFSVTAAGTLTIRRSNISNTGASTTTSTTSSGLVQIFHSVIDVALATSSTGSMNFFHSDLRAGGIDATSFTTAGTGTPVAEFTTFTGGTATALVIGAGTTIDLDVCRVDTSNAAAISGAGSLLFTPINFSGNSPTVTVTTLVPKSSGPVLVNGQQPAFLAFLTNTVSNVTGNGASYTIIYDTEVFDQGSNFNLGTSTFTAPFTGRYRFTTNVYVTGCTIATNAQLRIVTSNRSYQSGFNRAASNSDYFLQCSCLADMEAADTATVTILVNGEVADTCDIGGSTVLLNYFCGELVV